MERPFKRKAGAIYFDVHPMALWWHPTKNGNIIPANVARSSNTNFFFTTMNADMITNQLLTVSKKILIVHIAWIQDFVVIHCVKNVSTDHLHQLCYNTLFGTQLLIYQ